MATDLVFVGLLTLLGRFRSLIFLPIVTKTVGTSAYGVWVQVLALVTLFAPAVGLNLHSSLLRFGAGQEPSQCRRTYFRITRLSLLVTIVPTAILYWQATRIAPLLLGDGADARIFRLCALLIPATILSKLNMAYFRARQQIKLAHTLEFLVYLSGIAAAAVAFATGAGLYGGVVGLLLTQVACAVGMGAWIALRPPPGTAQAEQPGAAREYFKYALPTVPAAFTDWALALLDRTVIAAFVGSLAVGIYSANYSAAQLVTLLAVPFEYVVLPAGAALWDRGQRDRAIALVNHSLRVFLIGSLPTAFALAVHGGAVLQVMSTGEVGASSRWLLPPLLVGLVAWGATRVVCTALFMSKSSGSVAGILAGGALVNVLVNLALVPRIGELGAAWATLAAYLFTLVLAVRRVRRFADVTLSARFVVASLLASGACLAVLLLLPRPRSPVLLLLECVLALAVFLAVLLAARGVTMHELADLWGAARRRDQATPAGGPAP